MNGLTPQEKKKLISFRGYRPEDLAFILHTWLKGLYLGNEWFHAIDKKSYYTNYERILKPILTHPKTKINVACLEEDLDVILGYVVMKELDNGHAIHWVFIKEIWREIGLMKDLLKPYRVKAVTHLTHLGKKLKPNYIPFNPFL